MMEFGNATNAYYKNFRHYSNKISLQNSQIEKEMLRLEDLNKHIYKIHYKSNPRYFTNLINKINKKIDQLKIDQSRLYEEELYRSYITFFYEKTIFPKISTALQISFANILHAKKNNDKIATKQYQLDYFKFIAKYQLITFDNKAIAYQISLMNNRDDTNLFNSIENSFIYGHHHSFRNNFKFLNNYYISFIANMKSYPAVKFGINQTIEKQNKYFIILDSHIFLSKNINMFSNRYNFEIAFVKQITQRLFCKVAYNKLLAINNKITSNFTSKRLLKEQLLFAIWIN